MGNNKLLTNFCIVVICILSLLGGYWICSFISFRNSHKKVEDAYQKHIESVDLMFCDIKRHILNEHHKATNEITALMDSLSRMSLKRQTIHDKVVINAIRELISNSQNLEYATKFQKDSLLRQQESILVQEQIRNLLSLHIDKIDNDYAILGLWGAVLSILFIAFGFFAIFKIEETKKEAADFLNTVRNDGQNIVESIQNKRNALEQNINNFQSKMTDINQQISAVNTQLSESSKALSNINDLYTKSNDVFSSIKQQSEDFSKNQDNTIKMFLESITTQSSILLKNKKEELDMLIDKYRQQLENISKKHDNKTENDGNK